MDAINAFLHMWVKDQTLYCGNCGMVAIPEMLAIESCCDNPQIGRNIDHLRGVLRQNQLRKKELNNNVYGSNKENTFRYAISLPVKLLQDLEQYFKSHGEKLFNNNKELHAFMRKFPQLTVAEVV